MATKRVRRGALSEREVECLTLIATGYRRSQIAFRLKIKLVTVDLHLTNARRKLMARTLEEAVARAILYEDGFVDGLN